MQSQALSRSSGADMNSSRTWTKRSLAMREISIQATNAPITPRQKQINGGSELRYDVWNRRKMKTLIFIMNSDTNSLSFMLVGNTRFQNILSREHHSFLVLHVTKSETRSRVNEQPDWWLEMATWTFPTMIYVCMYGLKNTPITLRNW